MFFQPYRNYFATRQIYNERDFGQKYVKVWIRDADTDEALVDGEEMTESTDDKGRFKYTYKLPGDPTGNGRQLRIITVVYTDSGYTERDLNYQVEETNIVVRDMFVLGGGGGGGSDIDYKKIKEIVKEIVKKEISDIKPCEKTDLSPIKKELKTSQKSILDQIKGIIPKISDVNDRISNINIPKTDLSGVNENISKLSEQIDETNIIVDEKIGNIKIPKQKDITMVLATLIMLKRELVLEKLEGVVSKNDISDLKNMISDLENKSDVKTAKNKDEIIKAIKNTDIKDKLEKSVLDILETLDNIEDKL